MTSHSSVKFNSIWVEEMLTRWTFNASQPERSVLRRRRVEPVASQSTQPDYVYCQVMVESDHQDDSLVVARVMALASRKHTADWRKLAIRLGKLELMVHSSLAWQFERNGVSSLAEHESIDIEGGTFRLVLQQPSVIGVLRLELRWTPKRHLLVLNFEAAQVPRDEQLHVRVEQNTLTRPLASGRVPMQNFEFDKLSDSYYSRLEPVSNTNSTAMRNASCLYWMYHQNIVFTPIELETCRRAVDGCSMGAYFVAVQELARSPDACLQCQQRQQFQPKKWRQFGSRRLVMRADRAEVIFVLDGTCHKHDAGHSNLFTLRMLKKLARLSGSIERRFSAKNVITKFGLVTPDLDGKYQLVEPLSSRLNVSYLVAPKFHGSPNSSASITMNIIDKFWPSSAVSTFDFLELFSYTPPSTSRHFIVIDCLEASSIRAGRTTSCHENDIDFSTARTTMLNFPIYMHLITGLGIGRPLQNTPKLKRVMGIDWRQAFLGELPPALLAASQPSLSYRRSLNDTVERRAQAAGRMPDALQPTLLELRRLVRPYADYCHLLALETNGTVFDHRVLTKTNRHILAERVVDNHEVEQCQRCDCMLAKDRLVAEEQCTLCRARGDTLLGARGRGQVTETIDNNALNPMAEQVWSISDEDRRLMRREDEERFNSTTLENLSLFDFLFGQTKEAEVDDDRDDNL